MSFFVSKSLEGQVDENCLMPDQKSSDKKEFVLFLKQLECKIINLKFENNPDINRVSIKCEANIHIVDNIFSKNLQGFIMLKENKILVYDFEIDEILKKDSDSYNITISARYEVNNVQNR